MPTRRLLLCADDFAHSPGTSAVIADLARRRCLNAVSCMAASPHWPRDAALLAGIEAVGSGALGRVEVGLHLVLASEAPLAPIGGIGADGRLPGPDRLLARALAGRIDRAGYAAEIDRQFAAFAAARGRAPDFVDAHQHVHTYPGLRGLVIAATRRHAPHAWVRVPADRLQALLRRPFAAKALGSALHTAGLGRAVRRAGLAANRSFAGHRDFAGRFAPQLPHFFAHASPFHVIMCHPGADDAPEDPIAAARIEEAQVLGALPLADRLAALASAAEGNAARG